MINSVFKGAGMALLVASLATSANAQYKDLESLNPDIVAAASCSGSIIGLAINNYDIGVLNEKRTKDMFFAAALYQLAVAFEEESLEHFDEHGESYSAFETDATQSVLDSITNGNYTWQMQEEVDVCTSRMVKAIIPPYPESLQSQEIRDRIEERIHQRFDKRLEIYEAMQ